MTSCCSTGIVSSCQDFAPSSTKHVFCCNSWVGNAWLEPETVGSRESSGWRSDPNSSKDLQSETGWEQINYSIPHQTWYVYFFRNWKLQIIYNCWSLINMLSYMLQYFTILFPIKVAMVGSSILGETSAVQGMFWPIIGTRSGPPWDDHEGHLPRWLWLYNPDPSPKSVRWFPWHRWCGTWPPWLHVTGYMHHS